MNEEQYRFLCEACDSVLLGADVSIERVAIAWAHILNEHPINLAKYEGIFDDDSVGRTIRLKSALRTVVQATQTVRCASGWHTSAAIPESVDVLLVSHLVNEAQLGAKEDFYYGYLPEKLMEKGFSCVVVLRDHTGRNVQNIRAKWPDSSAPRLMFATTLSWKEEWSIRTRLQVEARRLRDSARLSAPGPHRRFLEQAARHAMSYLSVATLRFYMQLKRLAEHTTPKAIVVTYEGHAWERLAFAATREAVADVRCIGYQHTILFPRQHAVKRLLGTRFDPNIILTAGSILRAMLREVDQLDPVKIETVGTHRRVSSAMNFLHKLSSRTVFHCLAIPDGTLYECVTIFRFVLEAAALAPALHFILRMHPVLSLEVVAEVVPELRKLPANIEVSTKSIEEDFERTRWALYRGSGASIRAVMAGLRPFYVTSPNELSIDPLYKMTEWRRIVTAPSEFVSQVAADLQANVRILDGESAGAREFCEKYHEQVDLDVFCREIIGATR